MPLRPALELVTGSTRCLVDVSFINIYTGGGGIRRQAAKHDAGVIAQAPEREKHELYAAAIRGARFLSRHACAHAPLAATLGYGRVSYDNTQQNTKHTCACRSQSTNQHQTPLRGGSLSTKPPWAFWGGARRAAEECQRQGRNKGPCCWRVPFVEPTP